MPSKMMTTSDEFLMPDIRRGAAIWLVPGHPSDGTRTIGIDRSLPLVPLGAYQEKTTRPGMMKLDLYADGPAPRLSFRDGGIPVPVPDEPSISIVPLGHLKTVSSVAGVAVLV